MQSAIKRAILSGKAGSIYLELLSKIEYKNSYTFIEKVYSKYKNKYTGNPSINGRIFEFLICETLYKEALVPFYYQAIFERVPNAIFDVVLYNQNAPIVLTIKTSLRERYKQSDLEGLALYWFDLSFPGFPAFPPDKGG